MASADGAPACWRKIILFFLVSLAVVRTSFSQSLSNTSALPENTEVPISLPLTTDPSVPSGGVTNEASKPISICNSTACKSVEFDIIWNEHHTINPCNNFYEYACGGYYNIREVPQGKNYTDQFLTLQEKYAKNIEDILKGDLSETDSSSLTKAKVLYSDCVDTFTIERTGLLKIREKLDLNGGWPIISRRKEQYSWQNLHKYYDLISETFALYKISIRQNGQSPIISLEVPDFAIPRAKLLNRSQDPYSIAQYVKYIEEAAHALRPSSETNITNNDIATDIFALINFEEELANITEIESSNNGNNQDHPMTLQMWQTLYKTVSRTEVSKVNWIKTVKNLFNLARVKVESSENIVISNMVYFFELANLLDRTPPRTVVNYIHWKFISRVLKYGNTRMQNIGAEFQETFFGIKETGTRSEQCIREHGLTHAVYYELKRKNFSSESNLVAKNIFTTIKSQIIRLIEAATGLDENTKLLVKTKLQNIKELVGYPFWYDNSEALNRYYRKLEILKDDYFNNVLKCKGFTLKRKLKKLRDSTESDWYENINLLNGLQQRYNNNIILPVGILQIPLFNHELPDAINYGAIGSIIGREIFAALDGLLPNVNTNFFTDKFKQYQLIYGKTVPEQDAPNVSDSIATTIGLQAAYKAYLDKVKEDTYVEKRLSILSKMSGEKLFFKAFANAFCKTVRSEFAVYSLDTQQYSASQMKIIDSISSIVGFGEAYKCTVGSPMNPEKKYSL
ncbi:membrane metallo-endopeptidase-like 1 [Orussus abietinus]|uniref:membrane metallo-endopeptidase-like 1 n=1 Tax=Orussus abietinus TaxID=222816 RepID=UPI0006251405|nr:membrane metallo-endopeptidase-like 1 [Orussus abietinus]